MVDSKYYNIKDLNKMKPDKSSSLGLMHVNIASLDAHIDDLRTALGRLKFSFDVIIFPNMKFAKIANLPITLILQAMKNLSTSQLELRTVVLVFILNLVLTSRLERI